MLYVNRLQSTVDLGGGLLPLSRPLMANMCINLPHPRLRPVGCGRVIRLLSLALDAALVIVALASLQPVACDVLRVVPDEQRLLNKIYRNYDNSVRPVYNATHNVVVKFGLTLIQIMDMVSTILLGLDQR